MPNSASTTAIETANQITHDLRKLGVREGGVLLVHSSLSALGHVPGGPETVVRGLLQALSPEGTLLMPALSYEYVTWKSPTFDVRRTPSNVGAIPEHFRTRPGTERSLHPTHSVSAVGPRTEAMLSDHIKDATPCGPHSPFHKLRHVQGQLLMLGCGLRPNTSMHAIEELVVPPYLFARPHVYHLVDAQGHEIEKIYTPHSFAGWSQRYDRVGNLLTTPDLRTGHVLEAQVHLMEAEALWAAVLGKLREDELYFVDRVGRPRH